MIEFDPGNPFPLISPLASQTGNPLSYSYEDEKNHSETVDSWLGLNTKHTEDVIFKNNSYVEDFTNDKIRPEYWLGLAASSLQTPYTEIRFMLNILNPSPGNTVVDLGCAYGRMAHVIGRHYKNVFFVGYEYIFERVCAAEKSLAAYKYENVSVQNVDLSAPDFKPAVAEFYFLYDFGSRKAIQKTLDDLKKIALEKKITVVGRGRSSRDIIEKNNPWLSQINPTQHFKNFSIYQS